MPSFIGTVEQSWNLVQSFCCISDRVPLSVLSFLGAPGQNRNLEQPFCWILLTGCHYVCPLSRRTWAKMKSGIVILLNSWHDVTICALLGAFGQNWNLEVILLNSWQGSTICALVLVASGQNWNLKQSFCWIPDRVPLSVPSFLGTLGQSWNLKQSFCWVPDRMLLSVLSLLGVLGRNWNFLKLSFHWIPDRVPLSVPSFLGKLSVPYVMVAIFSFFFSWSDLCPTVAQIVIELCWILGTLIAIIKRRSTSKIASIGSFRGEWGAKCFSGGNGII